MRQRLVARAVGDLDLDAVSGGIDEEHAERAVVVSSRHEDAAGELRGGNGRLEAAEAVATVAGARRGDGRVERVVGAGSR